MKTSTRLSLSCLLLAVHATLDARFSTVSAQGTVFTYQGRLTVNNVAYTGNAEFQPTLWSADSDGSQLAANNPATVPAVITDGLFVLPLDFGDNFPGADRWLQLAVRTNLGSFTVLSPRQRLTAAPYALTAGHLSGTLPSAQLTGTYSGAVVFNNAANSFTGSGAGLTELNAGNLTSGLVPEARLGTNVARLNSSPSFSGTVTAAGDLVGARLLVGSGHSLSGVGTTIAGGAGHTNQGIGSTIGGGATNTIRLNVLGATISGGYSNTIQVGANYAVIGGGAGNTLEAGTYRSTIGGGFFNAVQAGAYIATIGGGTYNVIETNAFRSTIGGGSYNQIQDSASDGTISGGRLNVVEVGAVSATIAGGTNNTIQTETQASSIGGGSRNWIQARARCTTIGGGESNTVGTNTVHSAIGGGYNNHIGEDCHDCSIAGGFENEVGSGADSVNIAGGANNTIGQGASRSGIGGGVLNEINADASHCTIGGGWFNRIRPGSGQATISGGIYNEIATNGICATIPGGKWNDATNYAFAAGYRAKANHRGAFVWADNTEVDFASTTANQVSFRCNGGVRFSSGSAAANQTVSWTPGSASWSFTSDRATKEGFTPVDSQQVLEKVACLPITEWNYQGYPQRHIGPMAQDFHAQFPLNESETTLNDADLHGVALAAIQGLNLKVEDARQRSAATCRNLEERLGQREAEIAELKARLAKLEALLETSQRSR